MTYLVLMVLPDMAPMTPTKMVTMIPPTLTYTNLLLFVTARNLWIASIQNVSLKVKLMNSTGLLPMQLVMFGLCLEVVKIRRQCSPPNSCMKLWKLQKRDYCGVVYPMVQW